jgi:tetratricopeptide (TPR) repeat protein
MVQIDDTTTTTTTGARSLAAEFREVTIVAMEFIGPPTPPKALERLKSIVTNNGGIIVEERSDILVGVFGLEVPDGRDTQDAIDTALKLQRATLMDESTIALQIGIGVHPAKVVLMADGRLREDDAFFNALSEARGLAKKGVGWVTTDDTGRQLASQYFRFEDVTITSIEGGQQSVCKVTGRRPVAESYGRLFGRREELRTIGEVLAMVSRGTGKVMEIVGEAGTGKTRIVHEVRRRLVAGGHDVGWYEAACMPWRNSTPFAAVIAMFRSILGVGEIEPEHELRTKVERLRELGLIPEEVESVAVLLGAGGEHEDVGPDERGRQLRSALVRAASSLCSDKMTVFFWDDISYVDGESFEIIRYLSESLRRMPLLMILASRTGADFNLTESPVCHRIGLNPLSESDSKRLALSRIHTRRAPEDLLIDIALKSGGNPLYIEEYVKALIAGGIVKVRSGEATYRTDGGSVDFPKTLRGLVGARIKRLPLEQRALLQQASVLGHRFNAEIFASVTGVDVGELRTVLLGLKEVGLLSRISATDFSFASDLVRDVVYDGIILSDRRDIHAAVAHALEEKFADRLDDFVEKLAVHYREGGDRNKAVEYLVRAGEKVAASFSHHAALDYYIKALELLQNVPRPDLDKVLACYLPIGELCIKTNQLDLGIKKMRLAEELAEDIDDKSRLIKIMRINAELQARSEHYLESQQYFKRAIELADESTDEELRCEVRITAGQVYIWMGDMKKAAPYYREALTLSSASSNPDLLIMSSAQLAKAEAMSDEPEKGLETLKNAERMVDHTTHPATRCDFELSYSYVYYMMRDMEQALHYNLRALEIAKEYDIRDQIARNAHNIGDVYLGLGDYRKAFTYLRMSDEMAEEIGHELLGNLNNIFLAFIDALKFESNEGLTKLEKALARAMERNTVWEQVQVHYFLGRIHFERNQYDVARSHLEQTIRIGRAADNRVYDAPATDLLTQIKEIEG